MTTRAFEGTWRRAPLKSILRPFSGGAGTLIKGDATKEWEEGLYPGFSASGQDIWLDAPQFSGDGLVLSAVGARCGRVFRAAGRWGIVANTVALLPQDSADIRFLWYLTNREGFWERGGTAQPYVRVPETLSRRLLIPRSEDQVLIADFLDRETERIDGVVAAKRRMIELLEEERTALITHTVTKGLDPTVPMKDSGIPWLGEIPAHWEVAPLRRLVASMSDGPFGSALKSEHYSLEGARVIRLGNVGSAEFLDEDQAFVPLQYFESLRAFELHPGDMVIAGLGDQRRPTGRACVIPAGVGPAIHKADCYRVRLTREASPQYVAEFLSSRVGSLAARLMSQGTTRSRINTEIARRIPIAVPPHREQAGIEQFISRHRRKGSILISSVASQLTLLDEYRQALITAAVTGQLDEATLRGEKPVNDMAELA